MANDPNSGTSKTTKVLIKQRKRCTHSKASTYAKRKM